MPVGVGSMQEVQGRLRAIDRRLSRHTWYRMARNTVLVFNRREGSRKAAAMTYFALFSIFPFVLLLISLLSLAIDSEEARVRVISLLSNFLPQGEVGARQVIEGVVTQRGEAAGVGAIFLVWGALGWFQSIDRSVNEMWGVEVNRPFLQGKLFALAMVGAIAVVMVLSWLANIALGVAVRLAAATAAPLQPPGLACLWELGVAAISLGLIFLVFLLLYRFSPMCDLAWGDVWMGALITALLWEALRSAFAIYVTSFVDYSSLYGPIAAVIVFLLWLYVAQSLILFGAGLTYAMRLESQGIHQLRYFPCGRAGAESREGGKPAA